MGKLIILGAIIIGILLITLGWGLNNIYRMERDKRTLDGMYLRNYGNSEAQGILERRDDLGDWVCVNVRGMDFTRGIEVCQHECGHAVYSEIYAEICEEEPEECMGERK